MLPSGLRVFSEGYGVWHAYGLHETQANEHKRQELQCRAGSNDAKCRSYRPSCQPLQADFPR